MTVVPRPGADSTASVPPTRASRSRIPSRPSRPSARRGHHRLGVEAAAVVLDDGLRLARRTRWRTRLTRRARACLSTFVSASWTTRYRAVSTGGGSRARVQAGALEVDLDPGPLGPPLGVVRQGRLQAEVVQRRGPEFQGQVVDLPADQVGEFLQLSQPRAGGRRVRACRPPGPSAPGRGRSGAAPSGRAARGRCGGARPPGRSPAAGAAPGGPPRPAPARRSRPSGPRSTGPARRCAPAPASPARRGPRAAPSSARLRSVTSRMLHWITSGASTG